MKTRFQKFFAVAAVLAATAPALVAQEEATAGEPAAEPSGLTQGQALDLARIVNAASPDEVKEAIDTVVRDVIASAGDTNRVAGQLSAALAAAIAAKDAPTGPAELAMIVSAMADSAQGDASAALAERCAATIAAVSAMTSFADKVPEEISTAVADAVADPLSVISAREAYSFKEIFDYVLRVLTPGTFHLGTDGDAVFVIPMSGSGETTEKKKEKKIVRDSPTPVGRR